MTIILEQERFSLLLIKYLYFCTSKAGTFVLKPEWWFALLLQAVKEAVE